MIRLLSRLWSRFVAGCATLPEWDGGWMDGDGVTIETQKNYKQL